MEQMPCIYRCLSTGGRSELLPLFDLKKKEDATTRFARCLPTRINNIGGGIMGCILNGASAKGEDTEEEEEEEGGGGGGMRKEREREREREREMDHC